MIQIQMKTVHTDGLVQDCTISSVLAMEILQSCTKPSTYKLCSKYSKYKQNES